MPCAPATAARVTCRLGGFAGLGAFGGGGSLVRALGRRLGGLALIGGLVGGRRRFGGRFFGGGLLGGRRFDGGLLGSRRFGFSGSHFFGCRRLLGGRRFLGGGLGRRGLLGGGLGRRGRFGSGLGRSRFLDRRGRGLGGLGGLGGLARPLLGALLRLLARLALVRVVAARTLLDARGIEEAEHAVRRLRADGQPVADAVGVELHALLAVLRQQRIVAADPLDELAVARVARIRDDDFVIRPLLRAASGKPDCNCHFTFPF
jgi:hypothetical protein